MNILSKKFNIFVILISFICAGFFTRPALAASINFQADRDEFGLDENLEIEVVVDTDGEDLNAFEGQIIYSDDLLDFVDIRDNGSVVNFWVEKPGVSSSGQINFSGIVPGGYRGQDGFLFKMIFNTKAEGRDTVDIKNARVLINDGLGTPAILTLDSFPLSISKDTPGPDVIVVDISDIDPPEPFEPIITKIQEIAGDQYLLIFYAQDKGSGIDYYQVKEGYGWYKTVDSPYILKHQELDVDIRIKAVDKSGNERMMKIYAHYPKEWYAKTEFFGIIIIVVIIFITWKIARRARWKKQKDKSK